MGTEGVKNILKLKTTGIPPLNRHFYLTLPHVRWNDRCVSDAQREQWLRDENFDCTHQGYKNVYSNPYGKANQLKGDFWE